MIRYQTTDWHDQQAPREESPCEQMLGQRQFHWEHGGRIVCGHLELGHILECRTNLKDRVPGRCFGVVHPMPTGSQPPALVHAVMILDRPALVTLVTDVKGRPYMPTPVRHPDQQPADTWCALYHDGTVVPELPPDGGTPRDSTTLDRRRLTAMVLYGASGRPVLRQAYEPGMQMFYRRRHLDRAGCRISAQLLAWRLPVMTPAGERFATQVVAMSQDGHRIDIATRFRSDILWLEPIVPVSAEAVVTEASPG